MIQAHQVNFPPKVFETEINDFTGKLTWQLPKNNRLIDVFNMFNTNAVQTLVTTTGSSFLRPTVIVPPRILRFGAKFSW